MHPDCAASRIRFWAKNSKKSGNVFRHVLGELDEFISWGMTEGNKYILYDWADQESWEKAVDKYRDMKRREYANSLMATETESLLFLGNDRRRSGLGHDTEKIVFPDGHLWVRECTHFLKQVHNDSMVAYLLGIIDLLDLSKLCYSGDIIKTKHQVAQAKLDLKEWFFGGKSKYNSPDHCPAGL